MVKLISIYLFIGVLLLSGLFVNSLRGKSNYARAFVALSFSFQIYLLGYLLEINSETLEKMIFWNQIQYFGIPFFSTLWMIVSMFYTGRENYLKGIWKFLIFLIPMLTFLIRLTNEWHHLLYRSMELQSFMGSTYMELQKGPWYFLWTMYILTTLALSVFFYFRHYQKDPESDRTLFTLLFAASILPGLAIIFNIILADTGIDYIALVMPICAFLIYLAFSQYNFLDIKKLARERVFEESGQGFVLVNRLYQIVDYNGNGKRLLSWLDVELKETQLKKLLKNHEQLWKIISSGEEEVYYFVVDGEDRYLNVSTRVIKNLKMIEGYLITLEDVTDQEQLKQRLVRKANHDELTGLNNRRCFNVEAERAFCIAREEQKDLSVLMIDIDFFKRINDTWGHLAGDVVLREFAEAVRECFRETDISGRIGGEEFAVILINTEAQKAFERAEIFRKALEERTIICGDTVIQITVSIGVADLSLKAPNFEMLINRADQALYSAKKNGRNQTIIANKEVF